MAQNTVSIIKNAIEEKPEKPVAEPSVAPVVDRAPPVSPAATPPATPQSAAPVPTAPVKPEIDPEKETVAGQLKSLTASNSPYIRQAEKDTVRQANSRGLINSTMAAGAGREAAIRSALPIATQDASTYAAARENEQQNYLNIERDKNSAALNERLATLESSLRENEIEMEYESKTAMEEHLQSERFSDDTKIRIVENMNLIMRDSQQQIVDVGMSDRSAAQQASAIKLIEANRNASIKVYEAMLRSFPDWDWSTDFTPARSEAIIAAATPPKSSTKETKTQFNMSPRETRYGSGGNGDGGTGTGGPGGNPGNGTGGQGQGEGGF